MSPRAGFSAPGGYSVAVEKRPDKAAPVGVTVDSPAMATPAKSALTRRAAPEAALALLEAAGYTAADGDVVEPEIRLALGELQRLRERREAEDAVAADEAALDHEAELLAQAVGVAELDVVSRERWREVARAARAAKEAPSA